MKVDRYALIRPDGTLRAVSATAFDLTQYPGHDQYTIHNGIPDGTMVGHTLYPEARLCLLTYPLDQVKAWLVRDNDEAKGREVAKHLTVIPGQEKTYDRKEREAERWMAAGSPAEVDPADYPWAAARAATMGYPGPATALAEWATIAAAWEDLGLRLEDERERVNKAINDAETEADARAARASARYPQE